MKEDGIGARCIYHVCAGAAHGGVALRPPALQGSVAGHMLLRRVEADLDNIAISVFIELQKCCDLESETNPNLALLCVAALHTLSVVPVRRLKQRFWSHFTFDIALTFHCYHC